MGEKDKVKENVKSKETPNSEKKIVQPQAQQPKRTKVVWTLERCQKYARRFSSEILWASGSPSSYKSAVAHGWLKPCLSVMNTEKIISPNFNKKASDSNFLPSKKAA